MARKTRREKLAEQINARLRTIEGAMTGSGIELSDEKFQALANEATKLRDTLKML